MFDFIKDVVYKNIEFQADLFPVTRSYGERKLAQGLPTEKGMVYNTALQIVLLTLNFYIEFSK